MFDLISIEFYIHAMVALISCTEQSEFRDKLSRDYLFSKKRGGKEEKIILIFLETQLRRRFKS